MVSLWLFEKFVIEKEIIIIIIINVKTCCPDFVNRGKECYQQKSALIWNDVNVWELDLFMKGMKWDVFLKEDSLLEYDSR